ncbi:AbrB/MazE/SpoVT family DNA-binding domain-containing protein [Virgibacillus phasianinus]|uniref:AbrB/MazE/SpoVT family DNA-binding domain-containing protein n=1 Tax=Virgibacillus phasianinus TaxID=2017483 RepID=A0A220U1Y1_9BACI|nr:AbrB/MazE/SpoVT family DNA-binding domain-containing protein [Virgibacillus phasianinus]ASK62254.1 AbrB/MazE/SpoVT family DNA-binding domain-containing protein [Virgibacillus phasianinus]
MKTNKRKGVFSMTTKVQKWGNSLGVRIPQRVAERFDIENGSELELSVDEKGIILKPVVEDPTLEELLDQITEDNRHEEIDFGKSEGNELL